MAIERRWVQTSNGLDMMTIWSDPLISSTWWGGFLLIIQNTKSFSDTKSFSEIMKTLLTDPYFSLVRTSSLDISSSLNSLNGLISMVANAQSCSKCCQQLLWLKKSDETALCIEWVTKLLPPLDCVGRHLILGTKAQKWRWLEDCWGHHHMCTCSPSEDLVCWMTTAYNKIKLRINLIIINYKDVTRAC